MGRLPKEKTRGLVGKKVIWFHAASVGEVKVLSTVIPQVTAKHPEYTVAVSAVTKTGRKEAERILDGVELVFFLPVDLRRFVRRTLKKIKPQALILVETELWPNLIREAKNRGSLVALVNGRVSEKSLRRYLLVRNLFRQVLSHVDLICVQSEEHKGRMILLGAAQDKITITGNMKFDHLLLTGQAKDIAGLRRQMFIPESCKVIVGGSIRQGEELTLIRVFQKLKSEHDDLLLILAPRHLDRLRHLERMLSELRKSFLRKTQIEKLAVSARAEEGSPLKDHSLILLDTMGELSKVYSLAAVAFVGGSLVPVGGHNILEPAVHGVPVLFGPHINHFKDEARMLVESGGGIRVQDEEELYLSMSDLLSDDGKRKRLGRRAKEAVQRRTGVAQRTTDLIFSFLEKSYADQKHTPKQW